MQYYICLMFFIGLQASSILSAAISSFSVKSKFSCPDDYIRTPGIGWHKFHQVAATWNEARKICNTENAYLAVINSQNEYEKLLDMFEWGIDGIRSTSQKNRAFIGIHDIFEESEWVSIRGEPLYLTGFREWSDEESTDGLSQKQHCGSLFIEGGMDAIECNKKLAFFCEASDYCNGIENEIISKVEQKEILRRVVDETETEKEMGFERLQVNTL